MLSCTSSSSVAVYVKASVDSPPVNQESLTVNVPSPAAAVYVPLPLVKVSEPTPSTTFNVINAPSTGKKPVSLLKVLYIVIEVKAFPSPNSAPV